MLVHMLRPLGDTGARRSVDLNRAVAATRLRGARTRHAALAIRQFLGLRRVQFVVAEALPAELYTRDLVSCRRAGGGTCSSSVTGVDGAGIAECADGAVGC